MGADDGKLLYRDWLTPAENGPLLYVSSPTGNGEMVCAMEYDYYLDATAKPHFNTPYFLSFYDGSGYDRYSSDYDGIEMFPYASLEQLFLGKAYPHTGIIPDLGHYPGMGSSGQIRYTWPEHPENNRTWNVVVRCYLQPYCNPTTERGTGKKLYVIEASYEIFIFTYPDSYDVSSGIPLPEDPNTHNTLTFRQIVDITMNWNYTDWTETKSGTGTWYYLSRYVGRDIKRGFHWAYRKKGYGKVMPLNTASRQWAIDQGLIGSQTSLEEMLQTPGTLKVSI